MATPRSETTIVAFKYGGDREGGDREEGIIIGADTRMTITDLAGKIHTCSLTALKIFCLADYVYVAVSGSANGVRALFSFLSKIENVISKSVTEIADLAAPQFPGIRQAYGPIAAIIVGVHQDGTLHINRIMHRYGNYVSESLDVACIGTGADDAEFAMDNGDVNLTNCGKTLAEEKIVNIIRFAISVDWKYSGGTVDYVRIGSDMKVKVVIGYLAGHRRPDRLMKIMEFQPRPDRLMKIMEFLRRPLDDDDDDDDDDV